MRPPVDAARVRALARELSNAASGRNITVRHFDPYSQALAKIERGFEQDLRDVQSMVEAELVDPRRVVELFVEVEPMLFRYPAIDAGALREKVERAFRR